MVLIGIAVVGFNDPLGLGQRVFGIACLIADKRCIRGQTFAQLFGDALAGHLGVFAFIPLDRQGFQGFLGTPEGIGHHRHGFIIDAHHLLDAGHVLDLLSVKTLQLTAVHGAGLGHRHQHTGHGEVGAVHQGAVELVQGVQPRLVLTGNAPVFRVFEADGLGFGRFDVIGRLGHGAEGGGAPAGLVGNHPLGNGALTGGHLPLPGGSFSQHHTGSGAALTQILMGATNRRRAGSELTPPDIVALAVPARLDQFEVHLVPVAFQILGHQLRQAGQRALAHFLTGDADQHRLIGLNHHPGVHLGRLGLRQCGLTEGHGKTEYEGTGCSATTFEKPPAGQVDAAVSGRLSFRLVHWNLRPSGWTPCAGRHALRPPAPSGKSRSGRCW